MIDAFSKNFRVITGNPPFPWQVALFERFVAGDFPDACNLPTGLGKTAVIPIWLLALAAAPTVVPRRLVYVVNRRTVVDQATNEAEKIRQRLSDLPEVCENLKKLCADKGKLPLAISTLRGQFADNAEWRNDPARPAIVVGTVDMIGSRLLFSGYRCGFKSRPLHAGFLGQDAFLIHDEAHLEPAFQHLLNEIAKEQKRCSDLRPLRLMELTATSRGSGRVFGLTAEELAGEIPEVNKRIRAKKTIRLHECVEEKKLAEQIAKLALAHKDSGGAILVFMRKVDDVQKVAKKLPKGATRQLTGTLRGLERDGLVEDAVFMRFLPPSNRKAGKPLQEGTVYLVCTSAGEVGVNISANHLVCDLTPFDSMAQRFGRVNRFGNGDAIIDIVHATEFDDDDPMEQRNGLTLALLINLNGNASPFALDKLDPVSRAKAFSPPPEILTKSDILFDAWALTTIHKPLPGRPAITEYLHGEAEWQPPETYVAWREEVQHLDDEHLAIHRPEELLEDYPLKPHELLRDRTTRVFEQLESIAERFSDNPPTVWVLTPDADVEVMPLSKLVARDKQKRPLFDLAGCTVILPPSAGGIHEGLLDGESETANDVANLWFNERNVQRRARVWNDGPLPAEMTPARLVRTIDLTKPAEQLADDADIPARLWQWFVRSNSADDDGEKLAEKAVRLDDHCADVERVAEAIARALALPDTIIRAAKLAGRYHDLGKARPLWQRTIRSNDGILRAKSGNRHPPAISTPYRHEFGSLLDLQKDGEFQKLTPDLQDFVLHLVAAHHGRGRPHFPDEEVFDPGQVESAWRVLASEIPLRFARLQRRYGRWGLAYLESILRAADAEASARPTKTLEDHS